MLQAAHVVETAVALNRYSRIVRRCPCIGGDRRLPAVITFLARVIDNDELVIVQKLIAIFHVSNLTCNAVVDHQVVWLRCLMRVFEPYAVALRPILHNDALEGARSRIVLFDFARFEAAIKMN